MSISERLRSFLTHPTSSRLSSSTEEKTIKIEAPKEAVVDFDLFPDFLFWALSEFVQEVDTGPISNLPTFIREASPQSLPRDLQRLQKKLFQPLLKKLNGKKHFSQSDDLGQICQGISQEIEKNNIFLNSSILQEYETYKESLQQPSSNQTPSPNKRNKRKRQRKPKLKPNVSSEVAPSPPKKNRSPLEIILGINQNPQEVNSTKELKKYMKKIKGLGPVNPQIVWEHLARLQELLQQNPEKIAVQYRERVAGGSFKGWRKINIGRQWRIIFQVQRGKIIFRVGHHKNIYGTHLKKDKGRSL